ncbi:hypothetical protein [uncultured Desulfobacter sp.]|nr:hypothetical protein [uncultured Desulfobacter sp.]
MKNMILGVGFCLFLLIGCEGDGAQRSQNEPGSALTQQQDSQRTPRQSVKKVGVIT